jgi:perosamine synthetase
MQSTKMPSAMNMIDFTEPLANSSDYPAPHFTALPNITSGKFTAIRPILKGATTTRLVTRARYALALIAKAELSDGDTVLLPAYHCPALVEPFIWAGCKVIFYNITSDLCPDKNDLDRYLGDASAILFVRYFGFDSNIKSLAEYARNRGCLVIEDLAHAAFIDELFGDYGVTSLSKFYPVDSGAEIYVKCGRDSAAIVKAIERYLVSTRAWTLQATLRKTSRMLCIPCPMKGFKNSNFRYFDPIALARPPPARALYELSCHNHSEILRKRRKNYSDIHHAIGKSGLGSPVLPSLEESNAPYVYPFLLNDAYSFHSIRNAGIPLYRWEELSPTTCEVSLNFRSQLIQVPCHQDITGSDISAIAAAFDASVNIAGIAQNQAGNP